MFWQVLNKIRYRFLLSDHKDRLPGEERRQATEIAADLQRISSRKMLLSRSFELDELLLRYWINKLDLYAKFSDFCREMLEARTLSKGEYVRICWYYYTVFGLRTAGISQQVRPENVDDPNARRYIRTRFFFQ